MVKREWSGGRGASWTCVGRRCQRDFVAGCSPVAGGVLEIRCDRGRVEGVSESTVVLLTGANKGIGFEIAAGLGALGWRVGVARDAQRREDAVANLRAAGVDGFRGAAGGEREREGGRRSRPGAGAGRWSGRAGDNAAITGGPSQLPTIVDVALLRTVLERVLWRGVVPW